MRNRKLAIAMVASALVFQFGSVKAQDAGSAENKITASAEVKVLEGLPPEPQAVPYVHGVAEALQKSYPRSVNDLRAIQSQVQRVLKQVLPSTVGVQIGPSAGSGVIISPDGLVLTAGHVAGSPGRTVNFILADGRRVRGRTLGLNHRIDSGLMKITEKGPWPYVPMASSGKLTAGQWVVATGHPGGYAADRTPPVRVGRVLFSNDEVICTDCTLVGGDSGGPLFNMHGEVVGIHSRIGREIINNFHVPIATYHQTWDRLVAGQAWGGRQRSDQRGQARPYLGMHVYGLGENFRVTQVTPNTPAHRAGVKPDDVIIRFAGKPVESRDELIKQLWTTRPGQRVKLEIDRAGEQISLNLVVGGIARTMPGAPEYKPPPREERRPRRPPRSSGEPEANPESEPQEDDGGKSEQDGNESPPDSDGKDEPKSSDAPESERDQEKADQGAANALQRLASSGIEFDPVALRCVVARVQSGSAADAAGLRPGDVILGVGDQDASSTQQLAQSVARLVEVKPLSLKVLRGNRRITIELELPSGE